MKLTVISSDLEAKRAITAPGMAFWAGTGPVGETCRRCQNFKAQGYYSPNSKLGASLKKSPCAKYEELRGEPGPDIPHSSLACKYFIVNEKALPPMQPRS